VSNRASSRRRCNEIFTLAKRKRRTILSSFRRFQSSALISHADGGYDEAQIVAIQRPGTGWHCSDVIVCRGTTRLYRRFNPNFAERPSVADHNYTDASARPLFVSGKVLLEGTRCAFLPLICGRGWVSNQ
jgi:hypothetical protein